MSEKPLSEKQPKKRAPKRNKNISGVPGLGNDARLSGDTTPPRHFKAFHRSGIYAGTDEGYGSGITDSMRLFYSTREPVGVWWVKRVAHDIWDNWFRVKNKADKDDKSLDDQFQKVLLDLDAKRRLPQGTVFERRYGTEVLLLSYTGFGSEANWEKPLFTLNPDGSLPRLSGQKLLQITPYPWTAVTITDREDNPRNIRYGLPQFYELKVGKTPENTSLDPGNTIKVHWTRVIHDAPRLDEHPYEGVAALDEIMDDLVGGRNARWGAYESYYRHGTGFPLVKTKGTAEQKRAWVESGGLDDYLHARSYFICDPDEDFKFVGAADAALNPNTYFDMYFTFIAAATGVAKSQLQGVTAGRVTGSEVDERNYYKSISLHQNQKEPVLRELLDRLIQTGQVKFDGEYEVEWVDPFEVNPQDKAAIEFMLERTRALKTYMTINEIRAEVGLEPIDGGDVLMLQPGQFGAGGFGGQPTPTQNEPERGETEPENSEKPESTLLDRVLNAALAT